MKKNSGREFFEVFRRAPEGDKTTSWWSKKQDKEPPTTRPSEPATVPTPDTKMRPSRLSRDTTTPPSRVTLTFSREALAIVGIALLLALISSFIWGRSVGLASRSPREDPQQNVAQTRQDNSAPAGKGVTAVAPQRSVSKTLAVEATPKATGQPFWTLLVMSGVAQPRATQIAGDLRARGYDAFTKKVGTGYTVNVGRYADRRTDEATDLKQRFDAMVYKGDRPFRSCVWVKITDTGSNEQ